jgi:hypothetical protein
MMDIQQFSGLDNLGVPASTVIHGSSFDGIDLSTTANIILGWQQLTRTTNPDGSLAPQSMPINTPYQFTLTAPSTAGSGTPNPTVTVNGVINGLLSGAAGDPNFSGSFYGTATSAHLATPTSTSSDSVPVPSDLLALAQTPSRMHIYGNVVGTKVTTGLLIDPPAGGTPSPVPAPEPSTLAVVLVGLSGAAWRLRRTTRRG